MKLIKELDFLIIRIKENSYLFVAKSFTFKLKNELNFGVRKSLYRIDNDAKFCVN